MECTKCGSKSIIKEPVFKEGNKKPLPGFCAGNLIGYEFTCLLCGKVIEKEILEKIKSNEPLLKVKD